MIRYEVRRKDGRPVDPNILERFYGAPWRSVLGRLHHRHDGYVHTIYERCIEFKIYRFVQPQAPSSGGAGSPTHATLDDHTCS